MALDNVYGKFVFDPNFEHLRSNEKLENFIFSDSNENFIRQQTENTVLRTIFHWIKCYVFHGIRLILRGWWITKLWGSDPENMEVDVWKKTFLKAHLLRNEVVCCGRCKSQIPINYLFEDNYYCSCCSKELHRVNSITVVRCSGWVPFLNYENIAIWRKELESNTGKYMYKVKGSMDTLSARDFLEALFDIQHRMVWDKTTTDMKTLELAHSKYEVVYWKIRWPAPHLNRDYVFKRCYGTLHNKRLLIVNNKSILHPSFPEEPNVVRVKDFRSILMVDPCGNYKDPGIHYSLLYTEDPGEEYSIEMLKWFTSSGLSDFLSALVEAGGVIARSRTTDSIRRTTEQHI